MKVPLPGARSGSVAAASMLILALAGSVQGRDFFCAGGDISCLFDSMTQAKFNGEANTIVLDNGTYSGLQLPSIAGPLAIIGADPDRTIISAAGQSLGNIFFITAEGNLTLDRLTVTGALAGGIRNLGTLTLSSVNVRSNANFSFGGGISNSGTADVFNSTIANNASIEFSGGGIDNPGIMSITDSTIVSNTAGGAITSGNGILNSGTLKITNSTIARNTRPGEVRGGGIDNLGSLEITNSTISENKGSSGGGIANAGTGTTELRNTIVAGNIGLTQGTSQVFGPGGADCAGALVSGGKNLIGDTRDCSMSLQSSDITGNPGLASYTENTSVPGSGHYPLAFNSRAIDAGDPQVCPATDQLDNVRVGICDMGSVEFTGVTGELNVSIGITPKSAAHKINPSSRKNIELAIYTGNGIDVSTILGGTLRFGASGTETAPKKVTKKDLNRDRTRDLVLRFEIQDLGIKCGDTSLILTGQFADGQSFTSSTPITTRCKTQQ